jgi:hypothetical protein
MLYDMNTFTRQGATLLIILMNSKFRINMTPELPLNRDIINEFKQKTNNME